MNRLAGYSLPMVIAVWSLASLGQAVPIEITASEADASTTGSAFAGGVLNFFGSTDSDPVLASNGDGASSSFSSEGRSALSSSNGLATGSASGPAGGILSAVSATAAASATVSGAASASESAFPGIGFEFSSGSNSNAISSGQLLGGAGPVEAWGIVYAATFGGEVSSENGAANVIATATASVEDLTADSALDSIFGDAGGTVFMLARITDSDGVPGLTATAGAIGMSAGGGFAEPDEAASSSATANATAAAYGFFLPTGVEAIQGDNDFDGDVDADDINNLANAAAGGTDPSVFNGADPLLDSNLDTDVTFSVSASGLVESDSDYLIRVAIGTEYGDIDLDGDVDGDDFIAFQTSGNFGLPGGWAEGDFNGNGFVEGDDLIILQTNFGFSGGSAVAVPEPAAICLVLLALSAGMSRCKRSWPHE